MVDSISEQLKRERRQFLRSQKVGLFRTRKHPLVSKVVVGPEKIIVVRTKEISCKGFPLGEFEILVDFFHGNRVKILNISYSVGRTALESGQPDDGYDAPHVKRTEACWGNLENDVYEEFNKKDLYEIVCDSVSLLEASHKPDGYMTLESFLTVRRRMPRGFNFKRYFDLYPHRLYSYQQRDLASSIQDMRAAQYSAMVSFQTQLPQRMIHTVTIPTSTERISPPLTARESIKEGIKKFFKNLGVLLKIPFFSLRRLFV